MIGALTLPVSAPVPEEYAEQFDAENPSTYGENQVATGPYMIENDADGKLTGYTPNKEIHLVRNPNWEAEGDYRPAYLERSISRRASPTRFPRRRRSSPAPASSTATSRRRRRRSSRPFRTAKRDS